MTRIIGLLLLVLSAPAWAADFTVRIDQPFAEPFVGFGAQLNGWVYAFPNTGVGGTNEQTAQLLEQKIMALRPQHVRIFVEPNGFRQNEPKVQASMLRTFRMAQNAGATINATHWHGPHRPPEWSAQNMVNFLVDYIDRKGLTSIRYVTLQNEPNNSYFNKPRYEALYRAFDAGLREAGLRDRIKIIGGDLLRDGQKEWFTFLDQKLSQVLDGYSVHMYCDYNDDKHMVERVAEIPPIVAALSPAGRKPLYVMEFGFRGKREGKEEPGKHPNGQIISDMPLYGVLCAWRTMESLNRGYVAIVHWDAYDAWYDRFPMQYGLLGPAKEGWRERPHYWLFKMFTHTAGPGWQSLHIDGKREKALVSAMHSPSGDLAVYVLNRSDKPQKISVGGIAAGTTLQQRLWSAGGDGKLSSGADITSDGSISVDLPPQSVIALTTAASGL